MFSIISKSVEARKRSTNLHNIFLFPFEKQAGGTFYIVRTPVISQLSPDKCIAARLVENMRRSATAEDLPAASFAGQHESYLNISGKEALLKAVKNCFASLYTDRAIKYREDNDFCHKEIAISVGIQKMVRADMACASVCFTLEPESGLIDRDSSLVAHLFNEQNKAAKKMNGNMIRAAKAAGVKVRLCGQAPSDFPEFARFLVEQGIDSVSFNPDAVLKGIENINQFETKSTVPVP